MINILPNKASETGKTTHQGAVEVRGWLEQGVLPLPAGAVTLAPRSSSAAATAWKPLRAASISAVSSPSSRRSTSAPASRSTATEPAARDPPFSCEVLSNLHRFARHTFFPVCTMVLLVLCCWIDVNLK